jgi:hypothetical protein
MLLNLSNHPSANWSHEQMQAAIRNYGPVEDLSFPQVNPHAAKAEIEKLAKQYFNLIKEKSDTEKLHRAQTDDGVFSGGSAVTVHLMGELTFCFALLKLLQNENIPCVASTTDRQVLEEKDGRKTARFKFVQFREYA